MTKWPYSQVIVQSMTYLYIHPCDDYDTHIMFFLAKPYTKLVIMILLWDGYGLYGAAVVVEEWFMSEAWQTTLLSTPIITGHNSGNNHGENEWSMSFHISHTLTCHSIITYNKTYNVYKLSFSFLLCKKISSCQKCTQMYAQSVKNDKIYYLAGTLPGCMLAFVWEKQHATHFQTFIHAFLHTFFFLLCLLGIFWSEKWTNGQTIPS